ncbi:hypothetical protein ECE50_002465 [Chitinophaga sp. Mgbs1]|uniref:Uncharacterized protein n=1 Tax=Chitinophaga solisilvae TaxID=1233460 RepID=A0A433WQD1_9BACT|nr:hypothetical protein [Chitinophaga solisilvae]
MKLIYRDYSYRAVAVSLLIWGVLTGVTAACLSPDPVLSSLYAARFSARTSFIILCIILTGTGIKGIRNILSNAVWKRFFRILVFTFSINHFIHLAYIGIHHYYADRILFQPENIPGTIVYALIAVLPLTVHKTTGFLQQVVFSYLPLLLTAMVFILTYRSRLTSSTRNLSPSWLYTTFLVIAVLLIILNVYRMIREYSAGRD